MMQTIQTIQTIQTMRAWKAGTAIKHRDLVKAGAVAGEAVVATSPADDILGVAFALTGAGVGEDFCVVHLGEAEIRMGGPVFQGGFFCAGPGGAAFAAAPAPGQTAGAGGRVIADCGAGDIVSVAVFPQRVGE
jgi:hypothetical protein